LATAAQKKKREGEKGQGRAVYYSKVSLSPLSICFADPVARKQKKSEKKKGGGEKERGEKGK